MEKQFQFRYQTTGGLEIQPGIPAAEKAAFEQKHNVLATAVFNRCGGNAYVLALLTNDGKTLLRGLIIANAA